MEEELIKVGIYMTEAHKAFISQNGNMSVFVQKLINKDMEKDQILRVSAEYMKDHPKEESKA